MDAPTIVNGSVETAPPDQRIATLEHRLNIAAWLLAEQSQQVTRLATVLASMLATQMQPQVQQSILSQLVGQG